MTTLAPDPDDCPPPLSPEATINLLARVRSGDVAAREQLFARYRPRLRRLVTGRLPRSARGMMDTHDIVQDAMISAIRGLDSFEFRNEGSLLAFLRRCAMNRIIDVLRRDGRRPRAVPLPDDLVDNRLSPLDEVIGAENVLRYEAALERLSDGDREAIVGRVECQFSYDELATALGKPTPDAARMAVARALRRLADAMDHP